MRRLVLLWAITAGAVRQPPLPKSPSAAAVREAYLYAFATYARDAWGSDWLRPVARQSVDAAAAGARPG